MTSPEQDQSTGELLQRLNDAVGTLVRQELQQAKNELADKARQGAPGMACVGAAAVLGAASAGTSTVTLVRLLDRVLPGPAAAAVATAGLAGAAAALAFVGVRQLTAVNPVPEATIRSVRSDVEAVTESVQEAKQS